MTYRNGLYRLMLSMCLGAAPLMAQESPQGTTDPGATPASTPEMAGTEEKLELLATQLEAMQEPLTVLREDVSRLKGLKLSGYVQTRLNFNQASKDGIKNDGRSGANLDTFEIRRGRLKATWSGTKHSEVVLQIDATGKGVSLKDAYASVTEPWTPFMLTLTAGQLNQPFGFEIAHSSSNREFMERSTVFRTLFPGERERGLMLSSSWRFLRLQAGLFNGNSVEDTATTLLEDTSKDTDGDGVISEDEQSSRVIGTLNFGNGDRDTKKDFIGRLGVDFEHVAGGVSAYVGQWAKYDSVSLPVESTSSTTGVKVYDVDDLTPTYLDKRRFGVDLQAFYTFIPALGGTQLRGELINGHGIFDKGKQQDTGTMGYYVALVQSLGRKFAVAARYDVFDPDTAADETEDMTSTLEPALIFYPTSAIKISASYQIINDFEQKNDDGSRSDKANNQLTLQLQGKF